MGFDVFDGAGLGRAHRAERAMRTLIANRVAATEMKTMTAPKTEKEFEAKGQDVGIAAGIQFRPQSGSPRSGKE
jgi:hypothetical protein